ncbi:2-oxoglutarate-dependent ethylene/succinate-forming enzyme [Coniochaeta ligniaria NRRL 30616]|uniref:2-oxoglutarate-dependent ethylene/succinate-forming enzyme n=1 Tax=Coniochaeta ligniaria NRRL 30616 TaxID=1408157 RepID=A0A1J7JP75_9PEZI|nr:2-oxoglutarate-dependent ethylene/succinate-forming enzyme [Coniochaeta ligniaria NRRL 30616]
MSTEALSHVGSSSHVLPPFCQAPITPTTKAFRDTMPPGFRAQVGNFDTFELPSSVTNCAGDEALGRAMIQAWRRDGILQFTMTPQQKRLRDAAFAASKRFFSLPHKEKASCVDDQSYAGYIASGEEITDGIADYSEIFTVTKDLPLSDPRVQAKWPCHGPCPWAATANMKDPIAAYMDEVGRCGEVLLGLTEMGLGLEPGSLTKYTADGWHHSRVLRFPGRKNTNGKGKAGRGIGSHTDYGLLVISSQDNVGGLFVRPPYQNEEYANWKNSAAGMKENDDGWVYVPPMEDTFTVILGDMMQYLTNSFLMSTPHKVGLNNQERYTIAYFHEPNFRAVVKPLAEYSNGNTSSSLEAPVLHDGAAPAKPEGVHYGTHFTNMFMRNYPDRITTKRLLAEKRYSVLETDELRTMEDMDDSEDMHVESLSAATA